MTAPSDTSAEAHELQMQVLRAMSPSERAQLAADMSEMVTTLALAGIDHQYPDATPRERMHHLIRRRYGDKHADAVAAHDAA